MPDHPTHDEDVRLVRAAKVYRQWYEADYEALNRILTRYDALMEEHGAVDEITMRAQAAVDEMCAYFIREHKCMDNQLLCSMDCAIFMLKQAIPDTRAAHDKVEGLMGDR